jgi:hypothetical protein
MKYLIDRKSYDVLVPRLGSIMRPDAHGDSEGFYRVSSLYFDDMYKKAYTEKFEGVDKRLKYRIRAYNSDPSFIILECKRRTSEYVSKESIRISEGQFNGILCAEDGFLADCGPGVARDFFVLSRTARLRPVFVVDYNRRAFVYECGVRVTFDFGTQVTNDFAMFANNPMYYPITDKIVMEVKYTKIMPTAVSALFSGISLNRIPISKFLLCADKLTEIKSHA